MNNRRIPAAICFSLLSLVLIRPVSAQEEGLTITTTSLPNGGVGSPYSAVLQASGGDPDFPYSWSVSGLPGVSLQPNSTGSSVIFSGTPTAGGSFTVSASVSQTLPSIVKANETAAPQQFTVEILQITTTSPLPVAFTGRSYAASFSASGTPGPYMWTNSSGALPAGLTFNSQGTLSGTPTQTGLFYFGVSASDGSEDVTSMSFSLSVQSGFTINTSPTLAPGMVGVSYSEILTSTGGNGTVTFALSGGISGNALPPGLALAPTGAVTGTPTAAGPWVFSVTATDSTGAQAFANFSLTVYPALVITTASPLSPATAGTSYSQTFVANGGTSPYTFSISGSPPTGLTISTAGVLSGTPTTAGLASFTVQVTDNFSFSSSKQFQLNVTGASALLQVTPTQLAFSAVAGGDAPPPQDVAILSANGSPVNFAAQVVAGSSGPAPTWLSVSPATGATPGRLVVTVNQGTLTASPAAATIQITVPGNTAQAPILVSVTLTITTVNAQLQVTPQLLRFGAQSQSSATLEQAILVSNSGGSSISFTTSIQSQSPWITDVTPSSGQTTPNTPAMLKVDVNPQGLNPGSYHDAILINSPAGSISVPVSLFISSAGPILSVDVTGLRFLERQGVGSDLPRTVSVLNLGDPSSTINWTADLVSGANWLNLSSTTGTATPTVPGSLVLSPAASSSGFAAGPQYALLQISDPAALNSPQYVVAVLDVEPNSTPVVPQLVPAGLLFVTTASGSPPAQSVQVYASSAPVAFQVATATAEGGNWLTATATTSTTSATLPGTVSITANPTGLANGVYTGGVNISIGSVLRTVNVTLVVAPVLPGAIRSSVNQALKPLATSGCTPGHLALTENSLENNFAVPAGWPATLVILLNDDCGNPVTNGSVVASFSNGDPPLSLTSDLQTGTYSSTWQPGVVLPQITVNVTANAPSFPAAAAQFIGSVGANANTPPTLIPNGALSVEFDAPTVAALGGGLAPGNVVQVYGTGLASVAASTPDVPLDTQFNGTFMLAGGFQAPLYYVSSGLVNAQLPSELAPNQQYQIIVSANGALTLPETIDVVPYQPGVAHLYGSASIIAQHPNYSLVTASSPAAPGENLTIYLVGMGATNPPVPSGTATPLQAVPAIVQPTVTVGGQNATVLYAGLTPTGVGLYQINFTVPLNATTGNLNLVVMQNGTSSNTTTLPVAAP